MGDAYAELISDRNLLMMQVHALSAAGVPEIAATTRGRLERAVDLIRERTGAPDSAVQQFVAHGQLCHLIVATGLAGLTDGNSAQPRWASVLTKGMAYPDIDRTDHTEPGSGATA